MDKAGWVKIGEVMVDSGQLMLIDPCYVDGRDDFHKIDVGAVGEMTIARMFGQVHHNLGVAFESGYGDGTYPVYAQFKDGCVARAMVEFLR